MVRARFNVDRLADDLADMYGELLTRKGLRATGWSRTARSGGGGPCAADPRVDRERVEDADDLRQHVAGLGVTTGVVATLAIPR